MTANNVMGIIHSNTHDNLIRELTELRAIGSVPFGGRFRLIDFALSNFVNAGISRVGVITKSNYQSLMDHLGSGKAWDLARKKDGLFILPPYGTVNTGHNEGWVDALLGIMQFLERSNQEYVIMCDADFVGNIDIEELVNTHIQREADITIACKRGVYPRGFGDILSISADSDERVREIRLSPFDEKSGLFGLNLFVLRRKFLIKLIFEAVSRNLKHFGRDVLMDCCEKYKLYTHEITAFTAVIDSMKSYLDANMALLDPAVRSEIFNMSRPIYTKVRDDMPTRYGLGSSVSNSLLADGCVIEGTVENSILFRGVKVGKNAVVRNSIIMQDTVINSGANISFVIADKEVEVGDSRSLMGFETYPVFISKGAVV